MALKVGKNLVSLAQYLVSILQHRNIILPGYLKDFLTERSEVRNDDTLVREVQLGQLSANYFAFGAPIDVIEGYHTSLV